jgi:hypothetical protein
VPIDVVTVTTFSPVMRSTAGSSRRWAAVNAPEVITRNSLLMDSPERIVVDGVYVTEGSSAPRQA